MINDVFDAHFIKLAIPIKDTPQNLEKNCIFVSRGLILSQSSSKDVSVAYFDLMSQCDQLQARLQDWKTRMERDATTKS